MKQRGVALITAVVLVAIATVLSVRIGTEARQVDLQPCGGTHVARTGEIGQVEITKIEKKGRQNRRVILSLVEARDD